MIASDARLIELYDHDNPAGVDHAFYRELADDLRARVILDLGCGTGLLTRALATPGRRVIGIDPDATSLDFARRQPGADQVSWVIGDATAIAGHSGSVDGAVDLAVMTGNVAQHIPHDDWSESLSCIADVLRPDGLLAFETRNPAQRHWEQWVAEPRSTRDTPIGTLTEWIELIGTTHLTPPGSGTTQTNSTMDASTGISTSSGDSSADASTGPGSVAAALRFHNVFEETGEQLVVDETLVFRDLPTLRQDLAAAGFTSVEAYSGWDGRTAGPRDSFWVFVARTDSNRG